MNVSRKQDSSSKALISARIWRLLAVFGLALFVRLVYNLYIAQHRILDVGDSFYYLSAGRSLAKLVRESQSIQSFFAHLCTAAQFAPGSFKSFSSLALSDRLLIDGPIYPTYLATVFLLSGKALVSGALNVNQITFGLANSVLDSILAAVLVFLGEISFGAVVGIVGGIFWCFYLPAIINTQQCYGEPVVALLVTIFMALLFNHTFIKERLLSHNGAAETLPVFAIGVAAALLMLAKPAFVLLPAILLLVHFLALAFAGKLDPAYKSLSDLVFAFISLLAGLCVVLAPWLFFTATVGGAPRLIVNRAPGYNLYIGNCLATDGWKTLPVVEGVADTAAQAGQFIKDEFDARSVDLIALELRKNPQTVGWCLE